MSLPLPQSSGGRIKAPTDVVRGSEMTVVVPKGVSHIYVRFNLPGQKETRIAVPPSGKVKIQIPLKIPPNSTVTVNDRPIAQGGPNGWTTWIHDLLR